MAASPNVHIQSVVDWSDIGYCGTVNTFAAGLSAHSMADCSGLPFRDIDDGQWTPASFGVGLSASTNAGCVFISITTRGIDLLDVISLE